MEEESEVCRNLEIVHLEIDLNYDTNENQVEQDADKVFQSAEKQAVGGREDEELDREIGLVSLSPAPVCSPFTSGTPESFQSVRA